MFDDKHSFKLHNALRDIKAKDGKTHLGKHLNEVFKKLIVHYPDQALDKFEEVSYLMKHGKDLS